MRKEILADLMKANHPSSAGDDASILRAVFENVEGAMWLIDSNKRLIVFNHHFANAYKNIAGIEPAAGMEMYGFLGGENKDEREQIIDSALAGNKQKHETSYVINDKPRYFHIAYSPMFDNGVVTGVSCYATDITERKIAEQSLIQSEAYLHTIFDTTDVAYALFDLELNMLSHNQGAHDFALRELNRDIKAGDSLADFFYEDRRPMMVMASKGVFAGHKIDVDADFKQADGTMHWYNVRMYPITNADKQIFGLMLAITDISARKNIELQKEQVYNNLTQRNKDLEQFTYIVSHNLRAPIANIMGFSRELKNENDADIQAEYINQLNLSVDRLDVVIRDLNDILQLKQDTEEKVEVVKFSDMVENTKATIKNQLFAQNIVIEADFSEVEDIATKGTYMQSIFYNLISNSVKYRKPNVDTVIQIKSIKKKDSIILSFKDNGLGIDLDKKRDQVFGLYKRFHTHVADGKGMGLYITKTQTEILGGKISIHSEVDKGTEFYLEFAA
jgi:PAS domain S-box-containing protein